MSIDPLSLDGVIQDKNTNGTLQTWRDQLNPLITQYNAGAPGTGTVTTVSVVSANGLAGTVADATTTPAITLSTSITGILSGNGTAISAASTTGSGAVVLQGTPTITTPVISGTAASAAALGYDTTQKKNTAYGGATASEARIQTTLSADALTQTLTNGVATDQDFTSVYTFPANSIYTKKVYRATFFIEWVTGTSTVTTISYIKLGSTKIYTTSANSQGDGITRSIALVVYIVGRAAAGAAANVTTMTTPLSFGTAIYSSNTTDQPVALATNGTLDLVLGVSWSGTGSTETQELQGYIIEELN